MTTILGFRSGGVSWLAADYRLCGPNPLPVDAEKVMLHGRWMLALSGDTRLLDLVDARSHDIAAACSARDVAEILRQAVISDGWKIKDGPGSPEYGNFSIFLAAEDGLWYIACDFQVIRVADDRIIGAGSGHEYAEGAFAAGYEPGKSPEPYLRRAIEIAARFDPGTGGTVRVERVPAVAAGMAACPGCHASGYEVSRHTCSHCDGSKWVSPADAEHLRDWFESF